MKIWITGDVLAMRSGSDIFVRLGRSFVEARGFENKVFSNNRTHYSKRTVCLRASNDVLDFGELEVSLSKRFVFDTINTGIGIFFVLIFPGEYRYDRIITNERYLCIEHSKEERVTVSGESIIILF
jgi:hypothetical protein